MTNGNAGRLALFQGSLLGKTIIWTMIVGAILVSVRLHGIYFNEIYAIGLSVLIASILSIPAMVVSKKKWLGLISVFLLSPIMPIINDLRLEKTG